MKTTEQNYYIPEAVRRVAELYREILQGRSTGTSVAEELSAMATILFRTHQEGNPVCCVQLSNWHPGLVGKSADYILNEKLSEADARIAVAREHGFDTWSQVSNWGQKKFNLEFEAAVDSLLVGDFQLLKYYINRSPGLLSNRSPFNHRATLLHYIGSNGVETYRQKVPYNLAELTQFLLEAGADPEATAYFYGSQLNTEALLTTSAHPVDAGVLEATLAVLHAYQEQ